MILDDVLVFAAGFVAGGINALAGGGSFIAFPMLMFVGVPAINANATCSLAVLPGTFASLGPYKEDFDISRKSLLSMCAISLVGGLAGALVMLSTPTSLFMKFIPYLILMATAAFAFGNRIASKMRLERMQEGSQTMEFSAYSIAVQAAIAFYGGYFGAGIGIIMLAALSLLGMTKINSMNALKQLLSGVINGVAAMAFVFAGAIYWHQAIIMGVGSILGGFFSAKYGRKLPPQFVRRFVIIIGVTLAVGFFIKS